VDFGLLFGLMLGCASIFGSFLLEGGTLGALILAPAMIIVFGGTFATAMIGNPTHRFLSLPAYFKVALFDPDLSPVKLIGDMIHLAELARREGILTLEAHLANMKSPFVQRGLKLAIDGVEPEQVQKVMEGELEMMTERHMAGAKVFSQMGGYAPTMGIIGTVMGLIATLASAGGDPTELIHHIGAAFIATLWGVFMANIVWLPVADKLKCRHAEEEHYLRIAMIAVFEIQSGTNPSMLQQQLLSLLPPAERKEEGGVEARAA
jgi:chemotaxis protein MotA